MKSILHIIFAFETGGTETMLIDILNLQVCTNDVSLLIINDVIDEVLIKNISPNIKIYRINRKAGSKNFWPVLKLNFLLRKLKPDVIHIQDSKALPLVFYPRKKKVLTAHCLNLEFNTKSVGKIFAISKTVEQDLLARYNQSSIVVYNGILFSNILQKEKGREKEDVFKIIQVGRLEQIKGQNILIDALLTLKERFKINNVYVDFIGDGSTRIDLEEQVKRCHLEDRVSFLGSKSREFIYNNLKSYDLLLLPSTEEGFGLTIVEAMGAKLPLLVSNIDAPMEVINYGEYGFYFENKNSKDCAEKIKIIMESDTLAQTEKAYNFAITNFDLSLTVEQYNKNY